ncbi:MAG: PDZ domain-containing protein [SAR202 cluster bacterium]|nr:PDZ domain-containing protein [SAR202 cluster bacterium]|tara:strand:- start:524 stop:2173 length:1650 start_codon:yes stop_codon:yes gene_type:complete
MPETVFFGVVTFLIVLGPLIILHELGHLWTARRFGVKTLEFGFGYPPRAGGIWSGNTPILIDDQTVFEVDRRNIDRKLVTISTALDEYDRTVALVVRERMKGDDGEASRGVSIITGRIKSVESDRLLIADMLWSFNWLPLGGFVRMVGEESTNVRGSLGSKPRWQRIVVMAAGAAVNAIIPFILLPAVLMVPSDKSVGDVTIVTVFPDSPADLAGIKPGDKIVKVDGREIENIPELQQAVTVKLGAESTWEIESGIPNLFARPAEPEYQYSGDTEKVVIIPRWQPPSRDVVLETSDIETEIPLSRARVFDGSVGINTVLTVVDEPTDTLYQISERDASKLDPPAVLGDRLTVVATASEPGKHISLLDARAHDNGLGLKTSLQEGATGVQITTANSQIITKGMNPIKAFPLGWRQSMDILVLTRNAITSTLIGSSNPQFEGPSTVGPVGIGQLTGEIAVADAGIDAKVITLITLAATLSLSLAILNILPIPALDGGRIFFVLVEIVRSGKKISPEREGMVHFVGFALLIGLIAVISIQDVTRILRGESFF